MVNTFALGSWVAGFEFYNATRRCALGGFNITVITPGAEIDTVIKEVKSLGGFFDQIILSGYPPFVRDIIEAGVDFGVDWAKLNTKLLVAGEAVSIPWKLKTLDLIGTADMGAIINVYGMAECGIIGYETEASTKILRKSSLIPQETIGLYQYDAEKRFLEIDDRNHIILTVDAGIPLVRYDTMDEGRLIEATGENTMVCLFGRRDSAVTIYGVNIFADTIKSALDCAQDRTHLTGKFIMQGATDNDTQLLIIFCELANNKKPSKKLNYQIMTTVFNELSKTSLEYKKLLTMIGDKAKPKIVLKKFGTVGYKAGRKHKWVKKD